MYKLKLKTHFCAAHQLTHAYDHKCNDSIHGHNFKVYIEIEKEVLTNNMVVDFKKVKEIIDEFDHKNLNELIKEEPTAENISFVIYKKLKKVVGGKITVEIEESEGASIEYYKK